MANIELYMILGISGIFVLVLISILWHQIRQARKKSTLEGTTLISPSNFDSESKTKMMSRLDKRESMLRREQILEGGALPELSELIIYSPVKNEKITTNEVDVRGKTAVKSIVWINNQAAFVDVDGSFIGSVPLYKGKNDLELVVIGPYGKTIATKLSVNCSSKSAANPLPEGEILLPHHELEIHEEESVSKEYSTLQEEGVTGTTSFERPKDNITVSESEIDPSVLAALKGDPILDIRPTEKVDHVPLENIEVEIPELDLPDIPDILGPEEEEDVHIPDIPDVEMELDELETSPVVESDLTSIDETVRVLEEVTKTDVSSDKFPLDEMLPLTHEKKRRTKEEDIQDELSSLQLDEFQPLKQETKGAISLSIETKRQKLNDERSTEILQHSCFIEREDGELVPIIKMEKRIEKVSNKWYSTIGIVNISDVNIDKIIINEFISNTLEMKESLPVNVQEPVIDTIPEGVKITWTITSVKPQMKVFITYNESVNPLELLPEEKHSPEITIRK